MNNNFHTCKLQVHVLFILCADHLSKFKKVTDTMLARKYIVTQDNGTETFNYFIWIQIMKSRRQKLHAELILISFNELCLVIVQLVAAHNNNNFVAVRQPYLIILSFAMCLGYTITRTILFDIKKHRKETHSP